MFKGNVTLSMHCLQSFFNKHWLAKSVCVCTELIRLLSVFQVMLHYLGVTLPCYSLSIFILINTSLLLD
jgi:hypothetical protein